MDKSLGTRDWLGSSGILNVAFSLFLFHYPFNVSVGALYEPLTFFIQPLNPNVTPEGLCYFCFKMPTPVPVQDSTLPLTGEELHLMGHGPPAWPDVNPSHS
jgi:hypothetical protein